MSFDVAGCIVLPKPLVSPEAAALKSVSASRLFVSLASPTNHLSPFTFKSGGKHLSLAG